MNMKTYKAKHCKYLDGALYKEIFYEVTDIVEVKQFGRTQIDVTTSDGQSTTTKIFHDGNKNNAHLCNCRKLGKFLSAFKGNTIRNKRMDDGDMYIVGNGTIVNKQAAVIYSLTNSNGIDKLLQNISNTAFKQYTNIGFEEEVEEIINKKIKQS